MRPDLHKLPVLFLTVKLKACVHYFSSNFYFFDEKKCFLFHLKSSFRSQDIHIFVLFPFLSRLSRLKKTNGTGIIYDVIIGLHKFADAIFGITQKPLYIKSSNLLR